MSRPITLVQNYHLQASLKSTRPSVPVEELARLRKMSVFLVSFRQQYILTLSPIATPNSYLVEVQMVCLRVKQVTK